MIYEAVIAAVGWCRPLRKPQYAEESSSDLCDIIMLYCSYDLFLIESSRNSLGILGVTSQASEYTTILRFCKLKLPKPHSTVDMISIIFKIRHKDISKRLHIITKYLV